MKFSNFLSILLLLGVFCFLNGCHEEKPEVTQPEIEEEIEFVQKEVEDFIIPDEIEIFPEEKEDTFEETPGTQPGTPCKENTDCLSGICIEIGGNSFCTILCVEECPQEWLCKSLPIGMDVMMVCVPEKSVLCEECKSHSDCIKKGNYCIEIGYTGKYCGIKCETEDDCPSHYICKEIEIDGELIKQCYPQTQSCICTYEINGETKACFVENEWGKCFGEQKCDGPYGWTECSAKTPEKEVCDGKDNDCDGSFDEELIGGNCENQNEWGICKGKLVCEGKNGWVCDAPQPEEDVCDGKDNNCDGSIDEGFNDNDEDGVADCVDEDDDNDDVTDEKDNCPFIKNTDQKDIDNDKIGDLCDEDIDGDDVLNEKDNCPYDFNPSQSDIDNDKIGDECDKDKDGDGILNEEDNCPNTPNPDQKDLNLNGIGDVCEKDWDNDLIENENDNCPYVYNPNQEDFDNDKIGDACDDDIDGDGDPNITDCAKLNPKIHKEAKEICNDIDDNCNNLIDEEGAEGCEEFYFDGDGDGWGDEEKKKCFCKPFGKFNTQLYGDCDDTNANVYPNAVEHCDEIDNNCNGQIDDEGSIGCKNFYLDNDGDSFGVEKIFKCLCYEGGFFTATIFGDCDDKNKEIHPKADEKCDEIDNNCNGKIDEEGALGCSIYFLDKDGDGFGKEEIYKCLCKPEGDFKAKKGGDCDDEDIKSYPKSIEVCDGKDNNCDGKIDEDGAEGCTIFYKDMDGDGFGKKEDSKCLCKADIFYSTTKYGDCDDTAFSINPGANEICNNLDDNCNGVIDEKDALGCVNYYADNDNDGFGDPKKYACLCKSSSEYPSKNPDDCNDSEKKINPLQKEICNGIDDNCSNEIDEEGAEGCMVYYKDSDGDGFGIEGKSKCLCTAQPPFTATLYEDCDDSDPKIHPKGIEICNDKDDNCNKLIDEEGAINCKTFYLDNDGDGFGQKNNYKCLCKSGAVFGYSATKIDDCNDLDPSINPDAMEFCNFKDDNCNGEIDEGSPQNCQIFYADEDKDGYGKSDDSKCLCQPKGIYTATKIGDCDDKNLFINPAAPEVCNGKDDNCNGQIDEGVAGGCSPFFYDEDGDGWGLSNTSLCLCGPQGKFTAIKGGDCNDNNPKINPGEKEKCNGFDDNCDNLIDIEDSIDCENFYRDFDKDGFGDKTKFKCLCKAEGEYNVKNDKDCDDTDPEINPSATEKCNNIDDNCNNEIDEEGANGCKIFYKDFDKDGFGTSESKCLCLPKDLWTATKSGDCDDKNDKIHPEATEKCDNIDNNCLGGIDEGCDDDNDDFCDSNMITEGKPSICPKGDGDCNDNDPNINPGATEKCDNIDNNCDKGIDEGCDDDNDGFCDKDMIVVGTPTVCPKGGGDCNDNDPNINPGAKEIPCNEIDENCDGVVEKGKIIFKENFDDGIAQQWQISSSNQNVTWQVDNYKYYSAEYSLYWGNKSTHSYNYGTTNSTAETPSINIPSIIGGIKIYFKFVWRFLKDCSEWCPFDTFRAYVEGSEVYSYCKSYQCDTGWLTPSIDITPWGGKSIKLKFNINTIDSLYNKGEGIYLDDVLVEQVCP